MKKKQTILVTGGAGFIGSHLTDRLIKEGYQVVVIDNLSKGKKENLNPAFFQKSGAGPRVKFYKIDICSSEIKQIFQKEKPEIVFHFAAQIDVRKSVENPIKSAQTNILGSLNIFQNFIQNRKQKTRSAKLIFASSGGAIYGDTEAIPTSENHSENPLSPYGIEKLAIEKFLNFYKKTYGLNFTSLRFANIYGPRQDSKGEAGVIAIFCEKMLNDRQAVINGNGKQTRDFVFVDDVVGAAILAMRSKKSGIYNIGAAKETSINEIFRKLKKLIGSNCKEIHEPSKLGEQKRSCLNYSKAKKELGWQPKYNLEQGLEETVNYFKSF